MNIFAVATLIADIALCVFAGAMTIAFFRLRRRHRALRHDYAALASLRRKEDEEPRVTAIEALAGGGRRVEYGRRG